MGMMVLDGGLPAGLLVALVIFFLLSMGVIMVLWMALPFSVFGIKDLIRQCLKEQKETNEILKSIVEGEGAGKTDE
jgi:hypothetical protein